MDDNLDIDRRCFVRGAALAAAAVQLGIAGCARSENASNAANASTAPSGGNTTVDQNRPFPQLNTPENELTDLRRRINAARWPSRELVKDHTQGVQLATTQALASYWAAGYDWRKCEAKLNALPQFLTEIDGQDIHFIHVRSKHETAMPLIVTHGWPGSIIEQTKIIGPLTDPTAHGASASDAFHLVIPSIPGYGFSPEPTVLGWDPLRIARAWIVLMQRLGYEQNLSRKAAIGVRPSRSRSRCNRRDKCWPFTQIWPAPFRPTLWR